jgi:beta-lactamase regulating signal transducer with metallopeptidase domain
MIGALIDHLWQSTLFCAAIGSIALLLRANSAAVRHWLWMLASLKFLVPFSALHFVGAAAGLITPGESQPHFFIAAVQAATPMISPALQLDAAQSAPAAMLWPASLATWSLVSLGLAWRWLQGWRAAELLSRAARPAPGTLPDARITDAAIEPAVARVFQPVVLLPSALLRRLTPAQLDAVMAHEREHIARHDNLKAHAHRLVETLFWFHPLVWFIGRQLREERERACDEAVIERGHDPGDYAAGILAVCRHCAAVHSPHAMAALAGTLTDRVRHILGSRAPAALGFIKAFALSICTLLVAALPVASGAIDGAARRQELAVANSRALWASDVDVHPLARGSGPAVRVSVSDHEVTIRNTSLRELIALAYGVHPGQVLGGGSWLDAARYDIRARVPGTIREPTEFHPFALRGLVDKLLASRFDLEIHAN